MNLLHSINKMICCCNSSFKLLAKLLEIKLIRKDLSEQIKVLCEKIKKSLSYIAYPTIENHNPRSNLGHKNGLCVSNFISNGKISCVIVLIGCCFVYIMAVKV